MARFCGGKKRDDLGFYYVFIRLFVLCVCLRLFEVSRIRLFVRQRKQGQGSYIASVPLKHLIKLSDNDDFRKRHWSFEKNEAGWWLILEAF